MPDRKKLILICGICLAAIALLAALFAIPGGSDSPESVLSASPSPQLSVSPAPTASPEPTPTPTPTPSPEVSVSPQITDNAPIYFGPDLAEQERKGDEFFADALFVGNSLVHGLWGYGGIASADYAAATSASVVNLDRVRNEALWGTDRESAPSVQECINSGSYGKVYLLLGINEIGFEPADFVAIYSGVLDYIAAAQPEAEIYIMGLTPLTEKKNAAGYPFTMERVLSYNEALRRLAEEREYYYMDLVGALADESGFLPEADSTDGIHLTQEKYPVWAEYLRTHYAAKN